MGHRKRKREAEARRATLIIVEAESRAAEIISHAFQRIETMVAQAERRAFRAAEQACRHEHQVRIDDAFEEAIISLRPERPRAEPPQERSFRALWEAESDDFGGDSVERYFRPSPFAATGRF